MNGIHDVGGMTCFGPVLHEENEPVFHAPWERSVFALNIAAVAFYGPVDRARHAIERMDPVRYLSLSYYEKWMGQIETLAAEFGVLTPEEIETGVSSSPGPEFSAPDAEHIEHVVHQGIPGTRDDGRQVPVFQVGDTVRAKNIQPEGHTRLPRYIRGHAGIVDRIHGTFGFADTLAHDRGDNPQPLYSVRFAATELWGEGYPPKDHVYIDLFEDYLEQPD